eukprot:7384452-Prymnesium_polylepis.1
MTPASLAPGSLEPLRGEASAVASVRVAEARIATGDEPGLVELSSPSHPVVSAQACASTPTGSLLPVGGSVRGLRRTTGDAQHEPRPSDSSVHDNPDRPGDDLSHEPRCATIDERDGLLQLAQSKRQFDDSSSAPSAGVS